MSRKRLLTYSLFFLGNAFLLDPGFGGAIGGRPDCCEMPLTFDWFNTETLFGFTPAPVPPITMLPPAAGPPPSRTVCLTKKQKIQT